MNDTFSLVQTFFDKWNYYCLFFGLLFEGAFFTGFFVPGTLILVLGGFWSATGSGSTLLALSLSLCGIILGDNISYLVGKSKLSDVRVFKKFKELATSKEIVSSSYLVFFQFTSLTRGLIPLYLGIIQYPLLKWFGLNLTASLIFVSTMFGIGYLGGIYWSDVHRSTIVSDYTQYAFNVLLVVIIIRFYICLRKGMWKNT